MRRIRTNFGILFDTLDMDVDDDLETEFKGNYIPTDDFDINAYLEKFTSMILMSHLPNVIQML